jgi:nucleoside 2-deoxyribosyltransferase
MLNQGLTELLNPTEAEPTAQAAIRVYCAGKIAKNDWRHELFTGLRDACSQDNWDDCSGHSTLTYEHAAIERHGQFVYSGPFFIARSCGHGPAYHADGTHGVSMGRELCCVSSEVPNEYSVTHMCRGWIKESDAMFVWLDDPTAYGTVAEIGYAVGAGIPVFLFEPEKTTMMQARDMWFPRALADFRVTAPDPIEAFKTFALQAPVRIREFHARDGAYGEDEHPASAGFIYLIRADTGEYKIGRAKNVDQRLASFGGAKHPFKWEVIHTIEVSDACAAERHLHRLYERRRVNGEWFVLNNEDVEFIKSIQRMGAA